MVPMAPSWVISKTRNVVAKLVPDLAANRYQIEIHTSVSAAEMVEAEKGTVCDGRLVHPMNPERSGVEIKTIRGDYRDSGGVNRNRLRLWKKLDFVPRPDDIFQERLYCIQWITKDSLGKSRQETFFASVTLEDLARERKVEEIVRETLSRWQDEGLVPDMKIERGEETTRLIRERGWTHWHHLFGARHLLLLAQYQERTKPIGALQLDLAQALNITSRICMINSTAGQGGAVKYDHVFHNQALNTFLNFGCRGTLSVLESSRLHAAMCPISSHSLVHPLPATKLLTNADIFLTDPPYADAINYHEITEYFIAWLRKNPPQPFDQWTWDSQRELAIKGKDEHFRRDMVAAYAAMTKYMPNNGL
jgi:putative DNA methylase